MICGATVLPMAVPDMDHLVDLVERERIMMLPGPPTLYHRLLEISQQEGTRERLATLRAAVTGSADIPVELIRRYTTNCRSRRS